MGGRGAGRIARQGAVVAAGLALGVGGIAVFGNDGGTPSYQPHAPSVTAFSFATSVPEGPARAPEVVPSLAAEPADARDAVTAFLQPLADGTPEQAYPLLDAASRKRFPSVASWIRSQPDRPNPVTFEVGAARPNPERPGAFEVDLTATHTPSLDATRGLVPGRSSSMWLVRREADAWRVSAEPLSFRPVLPAESAATDVVQAWVSLLAACEPSSAEALQVRAGLYGPSNFVQAPCQQRGTWSAGQPVGLESTPDPRAFLAAFGPEVGTWARLVPVQGPGSKFLAAVAPMGDSWRVMGVAVGSQ